MNLSSVFHMYVTGQQGLFAYGDTGPNKYTANANGLLFYGEYFSNQILYLHYFRNIYKSALISRKSDFLPIPTRSRRCSRTDGYVLVQP